MLMALSCRFKNLIAIIALHIFMFAAPSKLFSGSSYGFDNAVSIVNPFNITGQDNIIKTFGAAINGFAFADSTVSCSFNSIYPVAGPVTFRGGKLYLQRDLTMSNTGSFADLGTIIGQNHAITLARSATTFSNGTNPLAARSLALVARVTATRTILSLDWSYDNQYLAVGITSGSGNDLLIYSFNGTTLTLLTGANLPGSGTSVRWRPNSYYVSVATGGDLRVYLFTPGPNTITLKNTQNPAGTLNSVAWQGRGNYLAVGGTTLYVYHFNAGTETLDVQYTTTGLSGTIVSDNIHWAPVGNKDDFIAGTNNGSLLLYNFTGAAVTHLKRYALGTAITSLDWAPTSTYMALGFSGGNIKTYQHTASTNTIGFKATATIASTVNSVSWKPNATELTAGFNTFSGNEHQLFTFNSSPSSYALTNIYGLEVSSNVIAVKFSNTNGTYIARADNTTRFLSVYKESSSPFIFRDIILYLNNNLTLGSPLNFIGNCVINGRNNTITFTGDGAINVGQNSLVDVSNTNLEFQRAGAFALQGRTSKLRLQDVNLVLDTDVSFGDGSWDAYQDVTITGPHTFFYETAFTSTIHANATFSVQNGAEFRIGRVRAIRSEPLEFEDNSAHLAIDNSTLHVTYSGLTIKKGIVDVYNKSDFVIDYTDTTQSKTTQALTFGDGLTRANSPKLILHGNGTELTISNGAIVLDAYGTPTMLQFVGQPQMTLVNTLSLYFKQPVQLINGWIRPSTDVSFFQTPNAYVTADNVLFDYTDIFASYNVTGTLVNALNTTLGDNDSIFVNRGNSVETLLIKGQNARLSGLGGPLGTITLYNANASLIWDVAGEIGENAIHLNGGKLSITQDVKAETGFTFGGTGTVDTSDRTFELGTAATTWNGNIYWASNGGTLKFNNNVTLSGIWTFSGTLLVDGQDYLIDLDQTGTIILERGAHVTFKHISLYNMSRRTRIVCQDDNCQITLNVADFLLSGDYLFDKGSIFVYWNSTIGVVDGLDRTYTFTYASTQTSTIDSYCYLKVLPNTRFSIGRVNSTKINPEQQPLVFNDPLTSKLILDGGTLHITSSGMRLTKGTMEIARTSNIEVDTPKYEYGLVLGNGTLANDFDLVIDPGTELVLKTGSMYYQNNQNNRIVFGSPASSLTVASPTGVIAKTNLMLQDGSLTSQNNSGLAINYDTGILGIQDNLTRIYQAPASYSVQKRTVHGGVRPYKLLNGDLYQVIEGYTTNDVIATAGSSYFACSAGFGGTLSLKDHTVTLQTAASVPLFCNIPLNGGTLVFTTDGTFANDYTITGSGKVQFLGTKVSFGTAESILTSTIYWQGLTSGGINLNANASLSSTWTFGGSIQIGGRGNILDLSNRGVLTIRPGATLALENIGIKGLGSGKGNINFMSDTSTLKLSNVYLELDNNFSTTIGGIIVNGPTVVGLKNYNWLLDQKASMTVDGVTLWQDPLDKTKYGKITFGSGPRSKYLSLVSSGTIKTATNLDLVTSSTNDIETQVRANSNALLYCCRTTSNALLFGDRTNSNAIIRLDRTVRTDSNAFARGIRNNSNAIVKLDVTARTNSNAFARGIRNNSNAQLYCCRNSSNAILRLDRTVRTDSNAFARGIRNNSNAIRKLSSNVSELTSDLDELQDLVDNNSNAIIKLDRTVRTNSNALLYCCRTTSNALLFGNRTNSNALLYCCRTTSNALLFGNRTNSNAIVRLDRTVRTDSNAFARGIRNNSNAILKLAFTTSNLVINNSNAIVKLDVTARTNSNAQLYCCRTSSNAIITLDRTARTDSNAFALGIRNNSNAIVFISDQTIDLSRTTSNALLYCCRISSNAIATLDQTLRTDSNAFASGISNNSNALLFGDRINSNTLLYLDRIDSNAKLFLTTNNSNAIIKLGMCVRNNSNAIVKLDVNARTTSNALLFSDRINSNTILKVAGCVRATSNTLLYCCRTTSNALLFGDRINSNTRAFGSRTNSNAIVKLDVSVRTTSNALIMGGRTNSNAFIRGIRNNSSAIISLSSSVRTTSNSLLYCCRTTSNTLLTLATDIRTTSNSLLYCCRTTSNAFLALAVTTSNQLVINNSNAIIKLSVDARTNSNALLALAVNTSNQFAINNSNAIVKLSVDVRTNSNALLALAVTTSNQFVINNSNAIVKLSVDARTDSNALLYCCRTTSNALHALAVTTSNQFVINNSNSIVWLNTQLQTIDHGPTNVIINTLTYKFSHDIFLSSDHRLSIQNSAFIDGHGHSIYLACPADGAIDIAPGSTVYFHHVAFRNYSDAIFNLGAGASVIFGDSVHLELLQAQTLHQQWTFTGNSEICGIGKELTVDPYAIVISPNSTLKIHGVALAGLKNTNLSCADNTSALILSEVGIYLDNDFNFLTGTITFDPNVDIIGTHTLTYASDAPSIIAKDSQLYMSGITFNFIPSTFNRDLFTMVDQSSRFFIDGCTIKAPYGMRLIDGTLIADHKNVIDNTGGIGTFQSILFGNGTPAHDLSIEVKPGGSLNLVGGMFEYMNS
jgi:hypothetical protein